MGGSLTLAYLWYILPPTVLPHPAFMWRHITGLIVSCCVEVGLCFWEACFFSKGEIVDVDLEERGGRRGAETEGKEGRGNCDENWGKNKKRRNSCILYDNFQITEN